MIRVVILGESLSGKTSLFDTLVYGGWHDSFCTTVTPSFGKYLDKYILFDTPGAERWVHFATPYIKVADAAIIVYDVEKGHHSVDKWKKILFGVYCSYMREREYYLVIQTNTVCITWGGLFIYYDVFLLTDDPLFYHPYQAYSVKSPYCRCSWKDYRFS